MDVPVCACIEHVAMQVSACWCILPTLFASLIADETEFEDPVITPYSNPPELPDVMKAPEGSATATD